MTNLSISSVFITHIRQHSSPTLDLSVARKTSEVW